MTDRPKPPSGNTRAPGFYKIVTGIEGLPPWVQYFDGRVWHGALPPSGATICGVDEEVEGDEEEEQEDDEELANETDEIAAVPEREPELEYGEDQFAISKIEVKEFKCRTCGSTELGQRITRKAGVVSHEILCLSCDQREKLRLNRPRLPLRSVGALILDDDGKNVAVCNWMPDDEGANTELAKRLVAAANACGITSGDE